MRATVAEWGARAAIALYCLASLTSCNIYGPLDFHSSDEAYLEAALACLHDRDYDCAIENYNQLSNALLKSEKLCSVNLTKAGFTLLMLVNTVQQQNDDMMGALAQGLVPWTTAKGQAAADALTSCGSYKTNAVGTTSANTGLLLHQLSIVARCAMGMARSDLWVTNNDTTCDVAGDQDGIVENTDVASADNGTLGTGMCKEEIDACASALTQVDSASLNSAGLGEIANAFSLIPPNITGSAVTAVQRAAIRDTLE